VGTTRLEGGNVDIRTTRKEIESDGDGLIASARWRVVARNERLLWLLVAVSATLDIVTTVHGLQHGLIEQNPLARGAIDGTGYWVMIPIKAGAIGVGLALRPLLPDQYTAIIPLALAGPWTLAVLINAGLIAIVTLG